jgi:hypothetical protein
MDRRKLRLADPELFLSLATDLAPPKVSTFHGPYGPVRQPTADKVMYNYPNNYRGWRRVYRHHRHPDHAFIIVQYKWTFIPFTDDEYMAEVREALMS